MSGPWEDYAPQEAGPWSDYGKAAPETPNAPTGPKVPGMVSVGRGLADIVEGAAGITSRMLPEAIYNLPAPIREAVGLPGTRQSLDKAIAARARKYEEARKASGETGIDWGRIAGNLPAGLLGAGGAARTALGRMGAGAAQGAVQGAMQPVTEGEFVPEKLKQAGLGAAIGGIIPGAVEGAARVIKPKPSEAVELLKRAGVTPTLGQQLGGVASTIEQKATSIPLTGDAILNARRTAVDEFNRAAINRSLAPVSEKLPGSVKTGNEAIDYAAQKLGEKYEQLLPNLRISRDAPFDQTLDTIRQMARSMPADEADQLNRILKHELEDRFTQHGLMSGEQMKLVESKLGRMSRAYQRSDDYDKQNLGDALQEAQAALREMVERGNPQYAGRLAKINDGWATLMRAQTAAGRQGSKEGIFSPEGYRGAVRTQDQSRNRAVFSRGYAREQDLSDAAIKVLGSTVPDSGTAGRALVGAGMLGGLGYFSPSMAIGAGAAALPYLPIGRQITNALLSSRPKMAGPVANALRETSPYLTAGGVPLLGGYFGAQ